MVKEIKIYVEGGGDSNVHRSQLRQSFGEFFADLRKLAVEKRVRWHGVTACGSRNNAFDDFCTAVRARPDVFNVLLVDAEAALDEGDLPEARPKTDPHTKPWEHLSARDGWKRPEGVSNEQCFLMVQSMESWLASDPAALQKHFKKFKADALPDCEKQNVERLSKKAVMAALNKAVASTGAEQYHKTRDGLVIVGYLNAGRVRAASASCDRLFTVLAAKMDAAV